MSAHHEDRRDRQDHRNEFALRRSQNPLLNGPRGRGVMDEWLDPIRAEVHRLVQAEPALASAGSDVLFARFAVPETAPDFASFVRRAALAVLAVRAKDREETLDPTSGDAAA